MERISSCAAGSLSINYCNDHIRRIQKYKQPPYDRFYVLFTACKNLSKKKWTCQRAEPRGFYRYTDIHHCAGCKHAVFCHHNSKIGERLLILYPWAEGKADNYPTTIKAIILPLFWWGG